MNQINFYREIRYLKLLKIKMQNLKSYFKTVLRRKIIGTIKNNFQIHCLDIHLKKLRVKIKLIYTKKKIKKKTRILKK